MVEAGHRVPHFTAVEECLEDASRLPKRENLFVLDFCRPGGSTDPAYSAIKWMLIRNGYLSQFVNLCAHHLTRDKNILKLSGEIINGVGRQILNKAGAMLWRVQVPLGLPTPSVFVGVDVFHAPKEYDPELKRRACKWSCAAIIVQVIKDQSNQRAPSFKLYSETVVRKAGMEYGLRDCLKGAVKTALTELSVNPMSCVMWQDGIGDSAFESEASEEIERVEEALKDMSLNK